MSVLTQITNHEKALEELSKKVDQVISASGTSKSVSSLPSVDQNNIGNAIIGVKNQLSQSKEGQVAQTIGSYTKDFLAMCPKFDENDHSTVGAIIEYAVDFVEKIYPVISQLLMVAATDSSPFKLQTCIIFITLVIPPAIQLSEKVIEGMINLVVELKNKIEETITRMENSVTPIRIEPKKKKGIFGLLKQ